jgi:hypothetical protein
MGIVKCVGIGALRLAPSVAIPALVNVWDIASVVRIATADIALSCAEITLVTAQIPPIKLDLVSTAARLPCRGLVEAGRVAAFIKHVDLLTPATANPSHSPRPEVFVRAAPLKVIPEWLVACGGIVAAAWLVRNWSFETRRRRKAAEAVRIQLLGVASACVAHAIGCRETRDVAAASEVISRKRMLCLDVAPTVLARQVAPVAPTHTAFVGNLTVTATRVTRGKVVQVEVGR